MNEWSVYIQIDKNNFIINIDSDAYIEDTSNWIKIDQGSGDKYRLAQGNYLDLPIFERYTTIPNYKYFDGKISILTEDEKLQYKNEHKIEETPSNIDRLEAQITYTAMMTNTLLGVII